MQLLPVLITHINSPLYVLTCIKSSFLFNMLAVKIKIIVRKYAPAEYITVLLTFLLPKMYINAIAADIASKTYGMNEYFIGTYVNFSLDKTPQEYIVRSASSSAPLTSMTANAAPPVMANSMQRQRAEEHIGTKTRFAMGEITDISSKKNTETGSVQRDADTEDTRALRRLFCMLRAKITTSAAALTPNTPVIESSKDGSAAAYGLKRVMSITLIARAAHGEYSRFAIPENKNMLIIMNALIDEMLMPEKTINAAMIISDSTSVMYFLAPIFLRAEYTKADMTQT